MASAKKKSKAKPSASAKSSSPRPAANRREQLLDEVPETYWAVGVAFIVGLATYLASANGLFVIAAQVQTGLFAGLVAGLVVRREIEAAGGAAAAVGLGVLVGPPWYLAAAPRDTVVQALILAALAAAGAVAATLLAKHTSVAIGMAAVMLMLLANVWTSTIIADQAPLGGAPPMFQRLAAEPDPQAYDTDADVYLKTFYLVDRGLPYYAAVRQAWHGNRKWRSDPFGVFSYRLPTIFWLWSAATDDGAGLIYLMLGFASLGVVAAFTLAYQVLRGPPALLAAIFVAAFYLFATTSPYITFVDFWAMAIGLAAAAAFARAAYVDERWYWAAAGLATLAALLREHLVLMLVAGLVVALLQSDRRRRIVPWLAGLGVVAVAYAVHFERAVRGIAPDSSYSMWLSGGIVHLWASITFAQQFFEVRPWFPLLIMLLGLAAIFLLRRRQLTVFLAICTLVPLAAFLFVGNDARLETGQRVGYWGVFVIPLLLSAAPTLLGLLPRPKPR